MANELLSHTLAGQSSGEDGEEGGKRKGARRREGVDGLRHHHLTINRLPPTIPRLPTLSNIGSSISLLTLPILTKSEKE
jgi:hypothetical protein